MITPGVSYKRNPVNDMCKFMEKRPKLLFYRGLANLVMFEKLIELIKDKEDNVAKISL